MQVEAEEISHKASFLEKVDIFGTAISIRFNNFKSHKTYLGGLMTIAILTIIGYQTVKLTKEVFDQDSPTIIQEHRYVYQPEIFNITRSSFNIAVGVQNAASLHFKNESVYYIRGTQQVIERKLNSSTGEFDQFLSYRSITLENCTQNHFQITETAEYFSKLPFDQLYCIALNETELAIEGEFSATKYKAIQFEVVSCTNTTTEQNCASQEIISSMLQTPRLGVYLSDAFVNVTNRDKPYYYVGRNLFWPSSYELQKEVRLYLQNNYISSDIGYFLSKMKEDRIINYSSAREIMTVRHNQVIFNFVIAYEKNSETTYQRSYPKLDAAFAEIGGFFNALISIGCILCWPISQLDLNRKLINSSFQLTLTPGEDDQNGEENQRDLLGNPTSDVQEYQQNQNSEKRSGLSTIKQNQLRILTTSLQQVKSKENTNLVISDDLNRDNSLQGHNLDNQDQFNPIRCEAKSIDVSITEIEKKNPSTQVKNELQIKQKQHKLLNCYWDQSDQIIETQQLDKNRELYQGQQQQYSKNSMLFKSSEKNIPSGASINEINMHHSFQQKMLSSSSQSNQTPPRKTFDATRNRVHSWMSSFSIQNCCKRFRHANKINHYQQNKKHSDIEISFMDYLRNYFGCCESKKSRLIRQGTDLLYRQIDIFYIIDKLAQIDKLKQILLTKHQNRLFDILPKPVLSEGKHSQSQHAHQAHSSQLFGRHLNTNINNGNKILHNTQQDQIITSQQNTKTMPQLMNQSNSLLPSDNKSKFMKLHLEKKANSQENCDVSKNNQTKSSILKAQEIQESIDILTSNAQCLSPIDTKILAMLDYPHSLNFISQKHEINRHHLQQQQNISPHIQLELLDEECNESVLDSERKSNENTIKNGQIISHNSNINLTSKIGNDNEIQNTNRQKIIQQIENNDTKIIEHSSKERIPDENIKDNILQIHFSNKFEISNDLEKQENIVSNKNPLSVDEALNEHDQSALFQSNFIQESGQNSPQTPIQLEFFEKASNPLSSMMTQMNKINQQEQ